MRLTAPGKLKGPTASMGGVPHLSQGRDQKEFLCRLAAQKLPHTGPVSVALPVFLLKNNPQSALTRSDVHVLWERAGQRLSLLTPACW